METRTDLLLNAAVEAQRTLTHIFDGASRVDAENHSGVVATFMDLRRRALAARDAINRALAEWSRLPCSKCGKAYEAIDLLATRQVVFDERRHITIRYCVSCLKLLGQAGELYVEVVPNGTTGPTYVGAVAVEKSGGLADAPRIGSESSRGPLGID